MNLFLFLLFAIPVWVVLFAVATTLIDRADRRRVAREHPGERWTPAGWKPVER